ncbi:hypothetical protein [Brazilian marseillevirus]|uniref:hypothetical protein n=1 Tax=Brazilian marseillevirus TaxID=1813599 RepID=UPI000784BB77|nr:hypothetical protein A3303_gp116 [Brazilian marseillevirus]AMQ10624.1 hypothetical protein [Brazilian marseillevirus]
MEFPNEIIFNILKFLSPKEISLFYESFPELELADKESFWKFYSEQKRHRRKPQNLSHEEWAKRMETFVSVQVTDTIGYEQRQQTVTCRDSVFFLRQALIKAAQFPMHKIFIVPLEDNERVPKSIAKLPTLYDADYNSVKILRFGVCQE